MNPYNFGWGSIGTRGGYSNNYDYTNGEIKPKCDHEWVNISLLVQKNVCKKCDCELQEDGSVKARKAE